MGCLVTDNTVISQPTLGSGVRTLDRATIPVSVFHQHTRSLHKMAKGAGRGGDRPCQGFSMTIGG